MTLSYRIPRSVHKQTHAHTHTHSESDTHSHTLPTCRKHKTRMDDYELGCCKYLRGHCSCDFLWRLASSTPEDSQGSRRRDRIIIPSGSPIHSTRARYRVPFLPSQASMLLQRPAAGVVMVRKRQTHKLMRLTLHTTTHNTLFCPTRKKMPFARQRGPISVCECAQQLRTELCLCSRM